MPSTGFGMACPCSFCDGVLESYDTVTEVHGKRNHMAKTAAGGDTDLRSGRRTGLDRDDVIAAALDLVVREGPAALTMRRLATDLDVGTPTIYWHVSSRDELI